VRPIQVGPAVLNQWLLSRTLRHLDAPTVWITATASLEMVVFRADAWAVLCMPMKNTVASGRGFRLPEPLASSA
jgi:hypothetical protein